MVAYEVISKWNAGLKEDMDARSVVYVLDNNCRKSSYDSEGYYWEHTPDEAKDNILGMEIVRDQSEVSLLGDCDVEKNGKWSYTYTVGSHVYQAVCMRPDIESADVDMLDEHMEALSTTEAGYMTLTDTMKEVIRLKGLSIESGAKLRLVAIIATYALTKASLV
nr:zinc finger, CCHC-type [Tanacetum cinerariifolium]